MSNNLANKSLRVLVVDDDRVAQLMHRNLIERLGYQVTVAGSGEEAITQSQTQSFDVICMDVNMPGIDGMEATVQIRKQKNLSQHALIIGITSYAESEQTICLAKGMNAVLNKPVQIAELTKLISVNIK